LACETCGGLKGGEQRFLHHVLGSRRVAELQHREFY
jgi:hypothetical protein